MQNAERYESLGCPGIAISRDMFSLVMLFPGNTIIKRACSPDHMARRLAFSLIIDLTVVCFPDQHGHPERLASR